MKHKIAIAASIPMVVEQIIKERVQAQTNVEITNPYCFEAPTQLPMTRRERRKLERQNKKKP